MHDVCLQGLPVIFAVDRAGLVGEDGATHQGCFDISYLRSIPNMVIMSPKDEDEIGHMLKTAVQLEKPVAIRYPRGAGQGIIVHNPYQVLEFGKAEVLREGDDVLILCAGPLCYDALKAADENRRVSCCVVNSRFLKPLDEELIVSLARRIGKVITIEENSIEGGFGSSVLELFEKNKVKADVKRIEGAFPEYEVVGISAKDRLNMDEFYEALFRLARKI